MWRTNFVAWLAMFSASTLASPIAADRPEVFVVHFEVGDASLSGEAMPILDNAASAWQQSRSLDLVVSGHTDRMGSDRSNLQLSLRRAQAVRTYLRQRFVPDTFIQIEARGERNPAAPTGDGIAEPRNRRAEIRLQSRPR